MHFLSRWCIYLVNHTNFLICHNYTYTCMLRSPQLSHRKTYYFLNDINKKKQTYLMSNTSILALDWKTVCDLWQSWAKAALRAVIFCRPSYVSSHWSGSISPRSKSKSTNALSNSFSKISSQRNDRVAAISTSIILHVKQQLLQCLQILPILSVDMIVILARKKPQSW